MATISPTKAVITSVGGAIGGGTSNSTQPVVTGTAAAGTYVNIYDGVRMIGTATVAANGTWSFTVPAALKGGSHSFVAIDIGSDGTFGTTSASMSVTIPASAPVVPPKPVINGMTDDHGQPLSNPTNNPHPNMSGTGVAGDTITVYDGSKVIGSTVIGPDGKWSFTPSPDLSSGTHDIYVIETSPAGVPSAPSDHTSVIIDTHVPAKPVINGMTDDHGLPLSSPTNDAHPNMSGTGAAGDTITVYDGSKAIGSTTIGADGKWAFTPTSDLSNGSHDIYVIETSPAGTPSAPSDHFPITVNAGIPATPAAPTFTDDSGAAILPGVPTSDAAPHINGKGTAGDIITVYVDGAALGTVVVGANGNWTFQPSTPLSTGATHSITVTESNGSGTSNHSAATSVTMSAASIVITGVYDQSSHLIPSGGSMSGAITVTGTVSGYGNGDVVKIGFYGTIGNNFQNAQQYVLATVNNGSFSYTFTANSTDAHGISLFTGTPGSITFTALAQTVTGDNTYKTYATSATYTVNENNWSVVPSTPVITDLLDAAGHHVVSGGSAMENYPTLKGTGHAGNTINVYDGATLLGTTKVGGDGNWSFKPATALPFGSHNLSATETSGAGTSPASAGYPFTVPGIVITGMVENNTGLAIANGGTDPTTSKAVITVTGWVSADLSAKGVNLMLDGVRTFKPATVSGNTFTYILDTNSVTKYYGGLHTVDFETSAYSTFQEGGTWNIYANFSSGAGLQGVQAVTDTATHDDSSQVSAATAPDPAAQTLHTTVSEHNAFKGASGHDTVDLNADPTSYFKEATAHIEGSTVHPVDASGMASAVNTLHLTGDHQILDLTSLTGKTAAAKISGIEVIDLGGHSNTLKLSLTDVLNLGETDLFQQDGKQQMMVQGKEGDAVDLSNSHIAGLAEGEWQQHGTAQVGGVTYNVYEHSGAHTELLVQQGVQIVVH